MPAYQAIDAALQRDFMDRAEHALGGRGALTRIATRLGICLSEVSDWSNGKRALPYDAAMHLMRWLGPSLMADGAALAGCKLEPVSGPAAEELAALRETLTTAGRAVGELAGLLADNTVTGEERVSAERRLVELQATVSQALRALREAA